MQLRPDKHGVGQANASAGQFAEIAAAANDSCGLTDGETLRFWGAGMGIPAVPQGSGYRNLTADTNGHHPPAGIGTEPGQAGVSS